MELPRRTNPEPVRMLTTTTHAAGTAMVVTDKAFYVALGQRIAEQRKALNLSQQQLAQKLGIAQQTLAHYEVGRLRVAAALLPPIAKTLGLSIEELLGEAARPSKRGPTPKLQEQIARIGALPRSKQRMLMDMIEAALGSADSQAA
jgi:transcriptional regulator with XRE-family HTH domain